MNQQQLIVPQEYAKEKLIEQIEKGKEIKDIKIQVTSDLDKAKANKKKWVAYVTTLLSTLFDDSKKFINEFTNSKGSYSIQISRSARDRFFNQINYHRKDTDAMITTLESIIDRLPLMKAKKVEQPSQTEIPHESTPPSKDIFIVHGRDEAAKQTVARFLAKLELNPIILHKQPTGGSSTVAEKLERYSDVGFAVILLTPDDEGYLKDKPDEAKPRARQNVILELGYFWGRLKRKNVCALYKEEIELPTDYEGVVYIPMDKSEGWKLILAREIKDAGIKIDPSKLL